MVKTLARACTAAHLFVRLVQPATIGGADRDPAGLRQLDPRRTFFRDFPKTSHGGIVQHEIRERELLLLLWPEHALRGFATAHMAFTAPSREHRVPASHWLSKAAFSCPRARPADQVLRRVLAGPMRTRPHPHSRPRPRHGHRHGLVIGSGFAGNAVPPSASVSRARWHCHRCLGRRTHRPGAREVDGCRCRHHRQRCHPPPLGAARHSCHKALATPGSTMRATHITPCVCSMLTPAPRSAPAAARPRRPRGHARRLIGRPARRARQCRAARSKRAGRGAPRRLLPLLPLLLPLRLSVPVLVRGGIPGCHSGR